MRPHLASGVEVIGYNHLWRSGRWMGRPLPLSLLGSGGGTGSEALGAKESTLEPEGEASRGDPCAGSGLDAELGELL